jgi:hypothetical protein
LAHGGLALSNGQGEFFPSTSLKGRGRGNRLRLPFGRDSRLLDPMSLDPLGADSPLEDLRHVARSLDAGSVPLHRFDTWFELGKALPKDRVVRPKRVRRARSASAGAPRSETGLSDAELWRQGLVRPGTLDAAIAQLFWSVRGRGSTEAQKTERIVQLLNGKHNGMSEAYNESLVEGERVVREKLASHFRRFHGEPRRAERPPLTPTEVRAILSATSSSAVCCDRDGVELKPFPLERFLFESQQEHKRFVIDRLTAEAERVRATLRGVSDTDPRFLGRWLEGLTDIAPIWEGCSFVVPWPDAKRATLTRMAGDGRHRYWSAARKSPLYHLEVPASWAEGRCDYVRVSVDLCPDGPQYDDVACAIIATFNRAERLQRYTRYYVNEIEEAAGAARTASAPVVGCIHPIFALVERAKARVARAA